MKIRTDKYSILIVLVLVLSCISMAVLLQLNIIPIECPFYNNWHIYCPGCGGTRMIKSIIHLEFYQAFRWNPLLFLFWWYIGFMILYLFDIIILSEKLTILYHKTIIVFCIIEILFAILRNTQMFNFLAPTQV